MTFGTIIRRCPSTGFQLFHYRLPCDFPKQPLNSFFFYCKANKANEPRLNWEALGFSKFRSCKLSSFVGPRGRKSKKG
jgi:hypothetical protein